MMRKVGLLVLGLTVLCSDQNDPLLQFMTIFTLKLVY